MLGCVETRFRRDDCGAIAGLAGEAGRGRPRCRRSSATASSCPRNIANSYLVTTPDGDVMINTGTHFEADGHQGALREGRPADRCESSRSPRAIPTTSAAGTGSTRPERRDDRAGQPPRRARVLAQPASVLRATHHETVGRLHGRRGDGRGPAPRTGAHVVVHRQPRVRRRRTSVRVVLDPRRRDHRCARGLDARTPHRVHRQPDGPVLRARAEPVHVARGQDSQRDGVHPLGRSRHRTEAADACSTATRCSVVPTRSKPP